MSKKPALHESQTVTLDLPVKYAVSKMVNRYVIEREDGFVITQFGLVSEVSGLIDRFYCIFTNDRLKAIRDNVLEYSSRIGEAKQKRPVWKAPPVESVDKNIGLPIVDFIYLCHWEDSYGEICFLNFSQGQAADTLRAENPQPVRTWGIALLRCKLDLQREFVAELFE